MVTRKTPFTSGEYYHVYNRGNSKQEIFFDDEDRERFVKLLYICNSKKNVRFREDIVDRKIDAFEFDRGDLLISIGAWVLMPNHFHIYLTNNPRSTLDADNNISLFVQKFSTAYSMYFNKKHRRTGGLFEGEFKSVHIEDDIQAKYLFSYIHLNPIKLIDSRWKEEGIKDRTKALKFLETYQWSSYHDFRGESRPENKIILRKDFPEYFENPRVFDKEIFEWLTINS